MADKHDVNTDADADADADADVFMIGIIHIIGMADGCYLTTTLANDNY